MFVFTISCKLVSRLENIRDDIYCKYDMKYACKQKGRSIILLYVIYLR